MRAVVVREFGDPKDLVVEDLPAPEPGPKEVLIDVRASGVNFPDLLVVEGRYQVLPGLPFSPGKEVSGYVEALGSGVLGLEVGDRVAAQLEYGGYSEKVAAPARNVCKIPERMSFEEGASYGLAYLTAYFALIRRSRLEPGESVLVSGASGGVGSAGVQLARALGARVIAVASTEEKREAALANGAHHAIAPDPEGFKERVLELTGGRGADVVLENVGGESFRSCLRATAWEGRLVVIGFAGGEVPTVKAGYVLVKNITVIGLQSSDYREREPESLERAQRCLLDLYERGDISVCVGGAYPLERAADALADLRGGRVRGKAVLVTRATGDGA